MRRLAYLIALLLFSSPLAAQQRIQIEGSIGSAPFTRPIQGASVVESSSQTRVLTDGDGRFILAARPGDTLQIKALGYEQLAYPLTPANLRKLQHKIVLQADTILLGEVSVKPGVLKPDKIVPKPEAGLPPGLTKASLIGSPLTYFYNKYSKDAKQRKKLQSLRRKEYVDYLQKEKAYYNSFFKDNTGYE